MDYTPHTDVEVQQMLAAIGVASADDLFEAVPEAVRLKGPLDIPGPLGEMEVLEEMSQLAARNTAADELVCFAGGGAYDHFIPAVVRALAGRSEFITSYTPYQPELSQGVLGALFEYQTMICELTGMEVSNSSLYDGAAALVEAVNLATSATGRSKVVLTPALNPNYRAVVETFGAARGLEMTTAELRDGATADFDAAGAACVVVAQPNFFGCLEDVRGAAEAAHTAGALLVVHYDLLSAGILEAPGAQGADIVTGEGQCLGNELNFGGPYLGVFATRMEHLRRLPGRVCGATTDADGKPGFVLTLQTREQHVRRDKATSNICTDQTLMAVTAAIYMSWLGPQGLREVGETCHARASRAAEVLSGVSGCSLKFDAPFFKEFVFRVPGNAGEVAAAMGERGYLVGPPLTAGLADCLLIATTEKRTVQQVDDLAKALAEVVA